MASVFRSERFRNGRSFALTVATKDIEAKNFGSGNADVSPTGDVEVAIFGSVDVRPHTNTRNVSTRTFGSGRTIQLDRGEGASQGTSSGDSVQSGTTPIHT
jgi:hypothetical protein